MNNECTNIESFQWQYGAKASASYAKGINKYKTVITVEDHVVEGGFGSYTLEVAAKYRSNTKVIPIAFKQDLVEGRKKKRHY